MAPISEKRNATQQPAPPQEVIIQASAAPTATTMLKDNAVAGGPHAFIQNALGHSHNQHHHHHGHYHHQNHQHSGNHHHHNYTHHHSNHHHAKENASGRGGKGLEILDFHESWLEEMEAYKDIMHVKKLGSHNHAHTPQGCQIEMVNNHHLSANKMSHLTTTTNSLVSDASLPVTVRATGGGGGAANSNGVVVNGNAKRRIVNENKTRVRVAATLAAVEAATAAVMESGRPEATNGGNSNQLHLKRPREETPAKTAASGKTTTSSSFSSSSHPNAKRSGHSSSHAANSVRHGSPNKTVSLAAALPPGGNNIANTATTLSSPTSPQKNNMKIVVNQFHASSLLNGHQLEEKEKILTQNGLTNNTPASAYEASYYAANYLNADARNNHHVLNGMTMRSSLGDPSNYVGVSLAKNGVGAASNEDDNADEDPCAAIDDVNTYSDSDSDDEYTGEPFYLKEDGNETLQSKNIRVPVATDVSQVCENSDDTSTEPCDYYTPKTILTPSLFPNVPPYLNYSSHARTGPPMPPQLHKVLKWKLSPVMPKIVKRVVLNSGFRIIKNTMDWMAVWEKHMKSPGFRTIRSHQKYNHMPGSFRIGRKDSMWRSIHQNMKKFGCKEFGFMQRSYVMPDDLEELRLSWPKNASRLTKWIVKPPASARGTGISIVNKWSQFPKDRPLVVQKYIERPLLINDNKFDMRIYVVLTSVNPLRVYMYKDGLARFASVKYSSELNSLDQRCMHLTNYSINKFSENYSKNEDFNACQGHKWTLQSLWSCLEERGVNTKRLWATLRNLVIKALVSGEAGLNRMYRQNVNFRYNCFELFGFDVLLDENLVPWLLEINISPSLHSELPLDLHVKGPLIQAVLNTALYQVPPKLSEKQQREILEELKLNGPLCHDRRIFTTCLRADEIRKHNQFTNRSMEYREEYLDAILDNLNPDDVRCLLISEDELNRCSPLERIFPTSDTHKYLKFVEHPRYYNRLLDAWENRYGDRRERGRELLRELCKDGFHLEVSDAAMEKEPNVSLTEIDLLHVKKEDSSTAANDNPDPDAAKSPSPTATLSDMDIMDNPAATADVSSTVASSSPDNTTIAHITSTDLTSPSPPAKTIDSSPTANHSKSDQYQQNQSSHLHHHANHHKSSNKESTSHAIKHNKSKQNETDRKLKTDIIASS